MQETEIFHDAVNHWWHSKDGAIVKKSQGGTRDANLGGGTMDGFAKAIADFLVGLGVNPSHIFSGGHLTKIPSILPSAFRPSKNWDVAVIANSRHYPALGDSGQPTLFAAVEFKSQEGSIGKNQNNRIEESLGNAADFWETYRLDGFERQIPRPWLGYLFIGKYEPEKDMTPVEVRQPHFRALPPFAVPGSETSERFDGLSYAQRYTHFIRRAIAAKLYDGGAFVISADSIKDNTPNHRIIDPEIGAANFLRGLKAQILAHYPGAAIQRGSLAERI